MGTAPELGYVLSTCFQVLLFVLLCKVMKAITKMVEDWIKTKTGLTVNQTPHLKEKVILLVKLMQNVEKRFADELELSAQFLELVNFIYRDKDFIGKQNYF